MPNCVNATASLSAPLLIADPQASEAARRPSDGGASAPLLAAASTPQPAVLPPQPADACDDMGRLTRVPRPGLFERLTAPAPRRLPAPDAIWLRLPKLVISAVLHYDDAVTKPEVCHLVRTRLAHVERFSQRLVDRGERMPVWAEMPGFDAADHVEEHWLAPGADGDAFMATCDALAARELSVAGPLWDMALIRRHDGPSSLMLRVHHALGDGPRLIMAMMICRDDGDGRAQLAALIARHRQLSVGRLCGMLAAQLRFVREAPATARRMLSRGPEAPSRIKDGQPVVDRAMRMVEPPWTVPALKDVARTWGGGTINDVLLAGVAGGLRAYLTSHGDEVDGLEMHCLQTVKTGGTSSMGNAVGTGITAVPVSTGDRRARFALAREVNRAVKASAEPRLAATMFKQMGRLSGAEVRERVALITATCSLYVSNVAGPSETLSIAGHRVANLTFCGPRYGSIGLEIPALSYNNLFNIGVVANRRLIGDVDHLRDCIADELRALQRGD